MIYLVRTTPDEMRGYSQTSIVTPSPLAHFIPGTAEALAAWRGDLAAGKPPAAWTLACEMDGTAEAPPAPARPKKTFGTHREIMRGCAFKRLRLYRMFVEHMSLVDDAPDPSYYSRGGPIVGVLKVSDEAAAKAAGMTLSQYRPHIHAMDPVYFSHARGGGRRTLYIRRPNAHVHRMLAETYFLTADEIAAAFECVEAKVGRSFA